MGFFSFTKRKLIIFVILAVLAFFFGIINKSFQVFSWIVRLPISTLDIVIFSATILIIDIILLYGLSCLIDAFMQKIKSKKQLFLIATILIIIIAAVWFFWPKSCGSGGFLPSTASVIDCECIGLKYVPTGCTDCGYSCSGIPIKYHCYTYINGTKTAEVPCKTGLKSSGSMIDFISNHIFETEKLIPLKAS